MLQTHMHYRPEYVAKDCTYIRYGRIQAGIKNKEVEDPVEMTSKCRLYWKTFPQDHIFILDGRILPTYMIDT